MRSGIDAYTLDPEVCLEHEYTPVDSEQYHA